MQGSLNRLCCAFVVFMLGPVMAADTRHETEFRAAYVPLAAHNARAGREDENLRLPKGISFHINRICKLPDICSLMASNELDVVFVMCPDAAQELLRRPGFRVSGPVDSKVKALIAGPLKNQALPRAAATDGVSPALQRIIKTRLTILQRYASDPLIVKAVQEANAQPKDQDEIKRIDQAWIEGTNTDFIEKTLNSNVSRFLRKKVRSNKMLYTEAFLCDRQGSTLGAFPKTSDYYQGDEAKFTACYDKGNGKVFTGSLEFDESSAAHSVQISVPIADAGQCIGVLVMGLRNVK